MATFRAGSVGKSIALGLLLGSFTFSAASCDAGYEQEAEEGIGEEEAVGEEGIGEEGEEGIGEE